ncbi:MAG: hypothetical protein HMLIMOIP_000764 [Candidatus Nitrosomirales archaeon]|jgi:hypothetical protein
MIRITGKDGRLWKTIKVPNRLEYLKPDRFYFCMLEEVFYLIFLYLLFFCKIFTFCSNVRALRTDFHFDLS